MNLEENFSIKELTTLKVGGEARYFGVLRSASDIEEAQAFAKQKRLPVFVLGGGSNVVASSGTIDALVLKNEIFGKEILEETENSVLIKVGAGEDWDEFVAFCVERGFIGVEALSAIPGTVGGSPIQNIGAYGSEASHVIDSVEVFDMEDSLLKIFSKEDCDFSYRDSVFKKNLGKFVVANVTFRLSKNTDINIPDYPGVKENLNTEKPNLFDIRQTIIKIRGSKLPDPKVVPNVGSFFKNPIVSIEEFEKIKEEYPDIKNFSAGKGYIKIPAGWLIEAAGLKGSSFGKVGTYKNNALVLVNEGDATFEDIIEAQEKIKEAVKEKFGIELEREPILIK